MTNYRQVWIDGAPVGMIGLDETFAALKKDGITPQDEHLTQTLIERLSDDNYIPYSAREIYAAALVREYANFYTQSDDDGASNKVASRSWRGTPRESVPWYPTVDETLCNGCGACLRMCTTGALAAADDKKVRVAEPFACVVGCNACAHLCKPKAILFPPRSILDAYQSPAKHTRPSLFGKR